MKWRILILAIMIPTSVYAAPNITSVVGSVDHDGSVFVLGTGFGVKSPVAPYFFDNFEAGTVGNEVPGNLGTVGVGIWDNQERPGTKYRTDQYYGQGSKSAGVGPVTGTNWITAGINGLDSNTAYYSIRWRWYAPDFDAASNVIYKPFRLVGTPGFYSVLPNIKLQGQPGWFYIAIWNTDNQTIQQVTTVQPSQSQWHRDEVYFKLGGSNDAEAKYWLDSELLYNVSGFSTGISNTIGSFLLPFEIVQNGTQFAFSGWADDVYFDNTQARVEICSGSTWAAKGTCEIQIPHTTWGDTSLQITVNQGALTGTNYIYVVDAAGDANTNGTEITFGAGESDVTAPTVTAAAVNGSTVTVDFDEPVVTDGYDANDCALTCVTAGTVNLTSPTGSGVSRTFTGSASVAYGDSCTLGCTLAAGDITDTAANNMITFSGTAVTNNTAAVQTHNGCMTVGGYRFAVGGKMLLVQ